ncbi:T9SS type A sorting domain-containing protein [uncultured Planktosalinus sp.]|uniref:T9SS type A sorting domain-containing protein n=1 Tax=uncultured Planktosalinus sp. TaxID=1810935 RepID=UPI0030D6F24C
MKRRVLLIVCFLNLMMTGLAQEKSDALIRQVVDLAVKTIQQVEVYTSSGSRVLQLKAQTTIPLDSLSAGVYFV